MRRGLVDTGFEDGGRGRGLRDVGSLQNPKEARSGFSPRASERGTALLT